MLMLVRYMMKLYEKYLEDVQMKHRLSHIEIAIIGFLYNNPERDTAADIVERDVYKRQAKFLHSAIFIKLHFQNMDWHIKI